MYAVHRCGPGQSCKRLRVYSGVVLHRSRPHHGHGAMSAVDDPRAELTTAELRDLRRLAGFMVPASAEYGVPGADNEAIFADIVGSLGRDKNAVHNVLAMLHEIAGG